jgi:5-methylcytosine-specific restriction endonuclease McrA
MSRQRADNFARGVRNHLLRASGGRCQQCGSTGKLEVDHIVPVAQGGRPEAANGQVLCWLCHRDKSARDAGRVFIPDRCQRRPDGRHRCPRTATLRMAWTTPRAAFGPRYQRRWQRMCHDCATYYVERCRADSPMVIRPIFRPLSGEQVAWRIESYLPARWYVSTWHSRSDQWRVGPTLGPYPAREDAEQAARRMAAELAAALGRPSDSQPP